KETMDYVPRLLAIARIFANADKYNIPLQPFPNKPYFAVVDIESQLDLTLATEMAQISSTDFFILNPAFKRSSTDPDGPFHLLIHVDKADTFKEKLAQTQKKDRIKWIRHEIKSGENLGVIARKYDTRVKVLRQVNHLANNNIRAGHFLLIPTSMNNSNAVARITNKLAQSQKKDGLNWTRHKIKSGENLGIIARKYHTSVEALRQGNHLASNNITAGQFLLIPNSRNNSNTLATIANNQLYIVKKGDTFWDIARQFDVTSLDIANWNKLSLNNVLQPGQKLIIKKS
ncbi:MAG: LysM peptidoglycan-binding domain-containing protein, partial [Thiotrichaceae bacterium]|nr:LysM peptidoglycan-binding domain-containing protein [Thiotrichaceae bacterium]